MKLHYPSGHAARAPWSVDLAPEDAGWKWTGLRILELPPGGRVDFDSRQHELLVLPLSGACVVECVGQSFELTGRAGVFAGATDFAYVPMESAVSVTSRDGGRFAVPFAQARRPLPPHYGSASDVTEEARGAGSCSRLVRGYCMDGFAADRLLVCEVVTPGGNWSSYPPHKHDEESADETCLEEIYYFEVAAGPSGPGVAYQRLYGTEQRPLDLFAEVRDGDVVLVPHGWHGPSIAAPGYDLYYLNAMAGPGERAWRVCDDPAHAWVRGSWPEQPVDPRVLAILGAGRANI